MTEFAGFMSIALLINLVPGPAMLHSIQSGMVAPRTGLAAALGVESGVFAYVIAAVTGLSAALVASHSIYVAVQVAGIAFLLYLAWTSRPKHDEAAGTPLLAGGASTPRTAYLRGFLLNVTNPKIAVFFLAVLPQFVPAASDGARQLLVHGLAFNFSGLVVNSSAALAGHGVGRLLRRRGGVAAVVRWVPLVAFSLVAAVGAVSLVRGGDA